LTRNLVQFRGVGQVEALLQLRQVGNGGGRVRAMKSGRLLRKSTVCQWRAERQQQGRIDTARSPWRQVAKVRDVPIAPAGRTPDPADSDRHAGDEG
jgi:hypothetical protein